MNHPGESVRSVSRLQRTRKPNRSGCSPVLSMLPVCIGSTWIWAGAASATRKRQSGKIRRIRFLSVKPVTQTPVAVLSGRNQHEFSPCSGTSGDSSPVPFSVSCCPLPVQVRASEPGCSRLFSLQRNREDHVWHSRS